MRLWQFLGKTNFLFEELSVWKTNVQCEMKVNYFILQLRTFRAKATQICLLSNAKLVLSSSLEEADNSNLMDLGY